MNLTKLSLLGVIYIFCISFTFATNVCIIESQSINPLHKMDEKWQAASMALGFEAAIFPQTHLDDINNLLNIDILIVSSGLIILPDNRRDVIQEFIENGGSVFLQTEYLLNLTTNKAFDSIIENLGGEFAWLGQEGGDIAPMQVLNSAANGVHEVDELNSFWFGAYGNGGENVEPIIANNDNNYGFSFTPMNTAFGKLMTTTDQDWIRTSANDELIINILNALIRQVLLDPSISISASEIAPCPGAAVTFTAQVDNLVGEATYQWFVNDNPIANANSVVFVANDLQANDVVTCVMNTEIAGTLTDFISNEVYMGTLAFNDPVVSIAVDNQVVCENTVAKFMANINEENDNSNFRYQWQINAVDVNNEIGNTFETSILNDADVVNCIITFENDCSTSQEITTNAIAMEVTNILSPTIEIIPTTTNICAGGQVSFVANVTNEGNNPSYQWKMNGVDVGTNDPTFTTPNLNAGQNIYCILTSDALCTTTNTINSATVAINITTMLNPALAIQADQNAVCDGEEVNFIAMGYDLGSGPIFQWQIDGLNVGNNDPIFSFIPNDGQEVTCIVTLIDDCATQASVEAEPITLSVMGSVEPTVTIVESTTVLCPGEQVSFIATGENLGANPSYQWRIDDEYVGENLSDFTTSDLTDGQEVTCIVTTSDNSACLLSNTAISNAIEMNVSNLTVELLEQENIGCNGELGMIEVEAIGGVAPYTYAWNTNDTIAILTEITTGIYELIVTDAYGCTATLETEITPADLPSINDVIASYADCNGQNGTAFIANVNEEFTYTWTTEKNVLVGTTDTVRNLVEGLYQVRIENEAGCTVEATFEIARQDDVLIDAGDLFTITQGEDIKLEAVTNGVAGLSFEWSNAESLSCSDCQDPIATPGQTTTYLVTATTASGCIFTDEVVVKVIPKRDVFIPNAFTPNADGNNDIFMIFGDNNVSSVKNFKVFDRWGQLLFLTNNAQVNDPSFGWDGTYKGKKMTQDVYVFVAEIEFTDGEVEVFSGDIAITK